MTSQEIIDAFPLLASDKDFKITSPENPNYNCIGWAYNYNNRWMQPPDGTKVFDGVSSYWPANICEDQDIDCLIDAFIAKGYSICSSWEHEKGYQKVALYTKIGTRLWTHASRELTQPPVTGKWTSKLGAQNDIQHSNPYTIEGYIYGKVYCIMKREFK